jgi:hypothetical protein
LRAWSAAMNRASRRQQSPALVGPRWPSAWPEESAAGTSPAKERTAARLANRVGSPSRPRIWGAQTRPAPETFVNNNFLQLKSTIELLAKNGWGGCDFDDQTIYVPLVIVPNAGIPATVLSDVDFKLRSHSALGELGKVVTSPGILIYRELQVFEGLSEHRVPRSFVEVLARWRLECTKSMPIRPQTFLDLAGADRPMSTYPSTARSMLLERLRQNTH